MVLHFVLISFTAYFNITYFLLRLFLAPSIEPSAKRQRLSSLSQRHEGKGGEISVSFKCFRIRNMLESGLSNGRIYPRTSADIRGWTDTDGRFEDTDGYGRIRIFRISVRGYPHKFALDKTESEERKNGQNLK